MASAAVSGLTPSPAALRASHPAPAERTAAWPPPATALRRPIALTPFWAAAFTRARVLAKLAGRSGPGYWPPGTKARAAGLTSTWTATPTARCRSRAANAAPEPPRTHPLLAFPPITMRRPSNCPCVPPGAQGTPPHPDSSTRVWRPRLKVVTPSPPTPVVDHFGCASPTTSLRHRPPTGTAMIPQRASSRSCLACPGTSLRLQPAHV